MSVRRALSTLLVLALSALALPAEAQSRAPRVYRVGVISLDAARGAAASAPLAQALRALGYVEGQNLSLEGRSAEGHPERLRALAAELARAPADVIVATSWQAVAAAQQSTTTVPIVIAAVADPVKLGFVESLAAPGANITGVVVLPLALAGSQLDLLKEAVARTSRIGVLLNPANPDHAAWRDLSRRAELQGMRLRPVGVRAPADLEAAFPAMVQEGVDGLLVLEDPMFGAQRERLAALAMKHGLPTMYGRREYVDAGGLLSYGPSTPALLQEAAGYVDRILKGARPRDLPVRQAAKLEMVVSRRTATALGLSIRASVLGRASHVIE